MAALVALGGPAATRAADGGPGVSGGGPERGFSSCLAVHGERVLLEQNADRLMTPASVQKLLVSAAALHYLGPDYRAETRIVAHGTLRPATSGGPRPSLTLAGDLVVVAGGDPTMSSRFYGADPRQPLRQVVRALETRGLVRVEGDLVVDLGRFPGRPAPASRAISEVAFGYGAPTAGFAVDEGVLEVEIAPGSRIGEPARISLPAGSGLRVHNHTTTVGAERDGRGTIDFQPSWHEPAWVVRGEYPISEPSYRIPLAVPGAELYAARLLARLLAEGGIEIGGQVRLARATVEAGRATTLLLELRSPPLGEWLPTILGDSANWYAEMLLRQLALAKDGEARDDAGLERLREFLVEQVGVAEDSFHLDDASGLSSYDLQSARTTVALLRWAWRQPWRSVFVDALARNGRGTLAAWPALPAGLRAKTGTLRNALALAGYLQSGSTGPRQASTVEASTVEASTGEPVVFACFLSHRPDPRPVLRRELADRVWGLAQ